MFNPKPFLTLFKNILELGASLKADVATQKIFLDFKAFEIFKKDFKAS